MCKLLKESYMLSNVESDFLYFLYISVSIVNIGIIFFLVFIKFIKKLYLSGYPILSIHSFIQSVTYILTYVYLHSLSGLASKVVPNSFHKLWQVQVPKFDFLSLSQVRVHEKQLPPQSFIHKKRKTPCSPAILPIFSHILVTTMIYSSVLILVCAISLVSSTSTQQEVREKVEEPQWKVGDCILGKN